MGRQAKIWIISDTHFGHENVIKFESVARPFSSIEEHDYTLVQRWNSVVRPQDTVWHLGDVFFGKDYNVLPQLMGDKRLVLGNHDSKKTEILKQHFKLYGVWTSDQCIFTHVPVHPSQLDFRFKKNVHGHLHSKKLDDKRYVNVSAEQINLTPVELREILNVG